MSSPQSAGGVLDPEVAVPGQLRAAILAWYDARGRSLPFRGSVDPYAVLVSEVMAQQTQIDRVGPSWAAFLVAFPTVAALAEATPADVLRAWAGLGYNRRALNLWRAARVVMERHGGKLPDHPERLAELPGIGPYTARAVAAIAFGRPVGAVDTNVRRVIGRVAGGSGSIREAEIQVLADGIVPAERPADWTHALMDVGATFCRSRKPTCADCPARPWCRFAAGDGAARALRPNVAAPRRVPFERTTRWLRGRILERLRGTAGDDWTEFDGGIGSHDLDALTVALAGLARDGLVELDPLDQRRARLATA